MSNRIETFEKNQTMGIGSFDSKESVELTIRATKKLRGLLSIYLLITISIFTSPIYAKYSGGTGEPNDPYQIATAEDLMLLGESPEDYDKHFILIADIDLNPNLPACKVFDKAVIAPDTNDMEDWLQGTPFTGVLDGNDHTISHLMIDGESFLGLFGRLESGAEVKNLGVVDVNITGSGNYVGALAGLNYGNIITSYSTGAVNGSGHNIGGLVGYSGFTGSITNSYSSGTITGNEKVGGLVGRNESNVSHSYKTGTVSGRSIVGGLVGQNDEDGSITTSYSAGTVSGIWSVGGLVGFNSMGDIASSYNNSIVLGEYVRDDDEDRGDIGGLAGNNRDGGKVTTSFNNGKVIGSGGNVGGLIGRNRSTLTTSFNAGAVSGGWNTGGLVGKNSGGITNSYNTGAVSGSGGLIGFDDIGTLMNCYNTGMVSGNGGLVGSYDGGKIIHCFWDTQASGQSRSRGFGGVGLTTAEMQTASTFLEAGWDFVNETENGSEDIWKISEGLDYPMLWWEKYGGGTGEPNNPYLIYTVEHLNEMNAEPNDWDKHFKLMADIDLDPNLPGRKIFDKAVVAPASPLGEYPYVQGTPFTGIFDGNSHIILHLTILGESFLGLFGYLDYEAKIYHLGLKAANINGTRDHVGSLAGINFGSIIMCHSEAEVNGGWWNVGGLIGCNYGSITTSHSTGTVKGGNVGGLVGSNGYGGSIIVSYSNGNVIGSEDVGGLVGSNGGSITMSFSTGAVTGNERSGGLVGSKSGSITSSFWNMDTSGQTTSAGGTGLTIAEMQNFETFINSGWDFVDENHNGTCDYWKMSEGDYPRLCYQSDESLVMPEGLGTPEEPYLIRDAQDLGTIWLEPLAHYRLDKSVDLSGITWSIAVVPWFGGTFDGNDYAISNLHIQGIEYLGMFGQSGFGVKIANLGMELVDVNGTGDYIGGLIGHNNGSCVTTSYATGIVRGIDCIGGLVGWNNYGSITNCYSSVMVGGSEYVGGLVGENCDNIAMSHSTGMVIGEENVGGLAGDNWGGTIIASYSTCKVDGHEQVGGFVGSNSGGIAASYSKSDVRGHEDIGGFVGSNSGGIITSYSTGKVDGHEDTGGLVGGNGGTITACYSTGIVIADEYFGGLVGYNRDGNITSSFWDIETSGQPKSEGGEGKTTAEMQTADTFLEAGWDLIGETVNGTIDIWTISEDLDYPRLWWQKYNGGSGTIKDPYRIDTVEDLIALGETPEDFDKHFILTTDIDLDPNLPGCKVFDRAVINSFSGTFDGNDHTISHLTIVGLNSLGLIGQLKSGAEIRDLGIVDVSVVGPSYFGSNTSGLVCTNNGLISNCYSTGVVSGYHLVGGLVGLNDGSIVDSYSTSTVSGGQFVGGLVGYNSNGIISTSYSAGDVTAGYTMTGGLVGENHGHINNCNSISMVSGNNVVGGLVGHQINGVVSNCCSSGAVSGNMRVGGLVGLNVGQNIGLNNENISHCYSASTVSGDEYIGGLVGDNNGHVSNSYSIGEVSGNDIVGGLVGVNYVRIYHCYSASTVRTRGLAGGLVAVSLKGSITSSFWDIETSGQAESTGGTGFTTSEIQITNTFLDAGWDFVGETANGTEDIWWILEGQDYPRLWWEFNS